MALNIKKIKNQWWFSVYLVELLVLLLLFLLGSLTIESFASMQTVTSTLLLASFLGIAAGGQTFVILLAAIDLSIPSFITNAVVLVGYFTGLGWPFYAIVLFLVGVAIFFGVINALVSKLLKIHSMITTLATGAMVEGLTYAITSCVVKTDGPDWLTDLSALNGHMGFIPFPPIIGIWAAYSVIALLLLHKTTWGKRLYAAGVNDDAAKLALVNTTWIHIGAFVFSSVSAVLAGILLAGFAGSAYFTVGQPYLFLTVGAVVVGGTMVIGGRGGYGRTIFGALIITLISTITIGYGFDTALQQTFLGFIIVFLMGCYGREQHLGLRM